MNKIFVTFLVVLAAMAGCHRRTDGIGGGDCIAKPGVIVTNAQIKVTLDKLSDDAVLISVGNRCYRKRDYLLDRQEFIDIMSRAIADSGERSKKIKELEPGLPWRFASTFVNSMPFVMEGEALGVVPTTNDLMLARQVREHTCVMLGLSFDAYANRYHGGVVGLNRKIQEEARNKAVFRVIFTNSLEVTDADVEKLFRDLAEANKIVAASNALLKADFVQERADIVSGKLSVPADSEEADKTLPNDSEVDHFEAVVADYFDDDAKLLVELQSLTNGQWTAVHESEEEYAIYAIKSFRPRNFQGPDMYSGTKIAVKKDLGFMVPDAKRARNDLRYIKNRDIVLPKTQELAEKYGVVFPNGTYWADMPLKQSMISTVNSK